MFKNKNTGIKELLGQEGHKNRVCLSASVLQTI